MRTLHRVIAIIWGVVLLWPDRAADGARRRIALVGADGMARSALDPAQPAVAGEQSLAARIAHPFSCQSDFRFILPVLLPFIIACARAGRLAQALLLGMALSSALFFTTL